MDLKKIKEQLEEQRADWQKYLDRAEGAKVEAGEPVAGDNAADVSTHTVAQSEQRGAALIYRVALDRVEAALRRLEAETFGTCTACGGQIDEKRLKAQPDLERCLKCAEEAEAAAAATQRRR